MNLVLFIGRVACDPQLYNGGSICKFLLAVDRRKKTDGNQEADFFPLVAFDKTADVCARYATKGTLIAVRARAQIREWENAEGKKAKDVSFIIDEVKLLSSPRAKQEAGSSW